MEEPSNRFLTQPFTFKGVADFARASLTRLFCFQVALAVFAAGAVTCFLEVAWVPVIQMVIDRLPRSGMIRSGKLEWQRTEPIRTVGSTFLWISVDPADSMELGEGADLQLEFGRTELRLRSLFGYWVVPYPKDYVVAFNHTELEPWWGAWHLPLSIAAATTITAALLLVWVFLALAYLWPVRLIAFYADRRLSWAGAWRMAAAALLPGAVFFSLAILGYTFHRINLVQLLLAAALHILIGWAYVLASPFQLPREGNAPQNKSGSRNPFGTGKAKGPGKNPFSDSSAKEE
jgi:hypothetical protein